MPVYLDLYVSPPELCDELTLMLSVCSLSPSGTVSATGFTLGRCRNQAEQQPLSAPASPDAPPSFSPRAADMEAAPKPGNIAAAPVWSAGRWRDRQEQSKRAIRNWIIETCGLTAPNEFSHDVSAWARGQWQLDSRWEFTCRLWELTWPPLTSHYMDAHIFKDIDIIKFDEGYRNNYFWPQWETEYHIMLSSIMKNQKCVYLKCVFCRKQFRCKLEKFSKHQTFFLPR